MRLFALIIVSSLAAFSGSASSTTNPSSNSSVVDALAQVVDLQRHGQYPEAERCVVDVIHRLEGVPGSEIALGVALNNLASIMHFDGRYAEAETRYWKAVHILEPLRTETAATANAYTKFNLARLYLERGRPGDAQKLNLDSMLDDFRDPESRARGEGTLAGLAAQRKEYASAEYLYLHALSFWQDPARSRTSQLEIISLQNNLALIAWWQGRKDLAHDRLGRSLEIWRHYEPNNDPVLARIMATSGVVCVQLGRYDDGTQMLERAAGIGRKQLGEAHPLTVAIQLAYADALKRNGRKLEAKQVERSVSGSRKSDSSEAARNGLVDFRELLSLSLTGRR